MGELENSQISVENSIEDCNEEFFVADPVFIRDGNLEQTIIKTLKNCDEIDINEIKTVEKELCFGFPQNHENTGYSLNVSNKFFYFIKESGNPQINNFLEDYTFLRIREDFDIEAFDMETKILFTQYDNIFSTTNNQYFASYMACFSSQLAELSKFKINYLEFEQICEGIENFLLHNAFKDYDPETFKLAQKEIWAIYSSDNQLKINETNKMRMN